MKEGEQRFIQELEMELTGQLEKEVIVAEYKAHIYEIKQSEDVQEENLYEILITRLGTPQEIAKIWKQETGITPRKTQWLFVLLNVAIFLGGSLVMVGYHLFHWAWLSYIWHAVMNVTFLVLFIYSLFWALLGYELGKEFGHRGLRLLKRTFLIAILPNLLFIYVIFFKLLPIEWMNIFVTDSFVLASILFTSILYPISLLGYYWGKKVSI